MVKVKTFVTNSTEKMDTDVTLFLSSSNILYIDLKVAAIPINADANLFKCVATLVYDEKRYQSNG